MAILHVPASPDRYPLTVADFRREHPSLAVGNNPRDEDLAPYGWRVVVPTDPPTRGPDQRFEQAPQPELVDGTYRQSWVLVDVEPPPPAPECANTSSGSVTWSAVWNPPTRVQPLAGRDGGNGADRPLGRVPDHAAVAVNTGGPLMPTSTRNQLLGRFRAHIAQPVSDHRAPA